MLDMEGLSKAVSETVTNLTNVVGLIEKNIQAYDRLRDRRRARRLHAALVELLTRLSDWRSRNDVTLWLMAEWASRGELSHDVLDPDESEDLLGDEEST